MAATAPKPARPPKRVGSVQQAFVQVQNIVEDVLCLGALGRPTRYVGILEVGGLSYDLKGQREQERLNDLWQQILAGIPFPVQLLWRSLPLRLDPYLDRFAVSTEAAEATSVWDTLASAHVQFVRQLASRRTLVQRRVYLLTCVSPDEQQASRGLKGLFWPGPPRPQAPDALEQARQELSLRLTELVHRLELLQLSAQRVSGVADLGAFYQSCLTPSTATQFPLSGELLEGADGLPQVLRRPVPLAERQCPTCQTRLPGWATFCGDCGTPLPEPPRERVTLPLPLNGISAASPQRDTAPRRGRKQRASKKAAQVAPSLRQTLFPQLADLLAPGAIDVSPDLLKVGKEWQQVLVVTGFPRTVEAGWLRSLLELDEPFDLSFHLRPQESVRMEDLLRRKRTQMQATKLLALGKGQLVDPHIEIALKDIDELIFKVASGAERLFDLVLLVRVSCQSKKELAERVKKVQQVLHLLRLGWRVASYEQGPALRACLPHGQVSLEGEGLLLPSEVLSTAFPFVASSLFHEEGVLVGVTPAKELVVLDPWEGANANLVVFGPSGAGKSTFIKTLMTRLALGYHLRQRGSELGFQLFVIDPDSEYGLVAAALGGQKVLLSPGASTARINPFDLPQPRLDRVTNVTSEEDVLAVRIADLHRLLEILLAERGDGGAAGQLTKEEEGILDLALFETYAQAGITRDPRTHTRPAPLLRDFAHVLVSGSWGGPQQSLYNRLRWFAEGSESGLFDGPTTLNLHSPLVVFDTHACQTDLQQIIAQFLISTFVWGQAFGGTIPRFLVVDEAATWVQYAGGKRSLEEYTQRARKHFLSVITIAQHPLTFANSTLIENSAIKWLMRPDPASLPLVRSLFDLSEREAQRLLRAQVGEALLLVGNQRLLVKNEISELELVLAQTNPRRVAEWLRKPEYAHLRRLLQQLAAGGLRDLARYLADEEAAS